MQLALYSASTGMMAQQHNLDSIANDMANVNTVGYKRTQNEFQDLIYQNLKPVGADAGSGQVTPTGVQIGNGTRLASTTKIFTQGQLTQTNEQFDLAIEGQGFFEVELPDGRTVYTRAGTLKPNQDGQIVTSDGYVVKSGFTTLPKDMQNLFIAPNGQVTVETPQGSQNFRIQLARFANPSGLKNLGGSLLEATEASGEAELGNPSENAFGSIRQGYQEMSNVNIVQSMVNMITAQRAYEINAKAIQTSDEMLSKINQLK